MENLQVWLDAFRKADIYDIIDITVISVLIYQFWMLIKRTRTVLLINGIVVVLVLYFMSKKLHLSVLPWFFGDNWKSLIVAIAIILQPELRLVLEQIGRGKFFTMHTLTAGPEEYKKLIEELIRCNRLLSQNRIGALIVIEKVTGVQEYINSGVKIDGVVSSEFLVNLFIPKSPLHDGAVIIRGDRVAAARCFLPLAQDKGLQKDLGTRHRAGIGLSEVSDALVIIVSEETGVISIAKNGEITRFHDENSLRTILKNEILLKNSKWANPFRKDKYNA